MTASTIAVPSGAVAISVGDHVVLIDEADVALIATHAWYVLRTKGKSYAYTFIKRRITYMHRLLAGVDDGLEVDHKNGDGLDNRRLNLRSATHAQNTANRGKSGFRAGKPTSSPLKGVSWHKQAKKWQALITVRGKRSSLGLFADEVDAGRAYDAAALAAHGAFARLNFLPEVSS